LIFNCFEIYFYRNNHDAKDLQIINIRHLRKLIQQEFPQTGIDFFFLDSELTAYLMEKNLQIQAKVSDRRFPESILIYWQGFFAGKAKMNIQRRHFYK